MRSRTAGNYSVLVCCGVGQVVFDARMFFEVSVNLGGRKQSTASYATASAASTDLNRHRDAWLPIEKTRKVFIAQASAPPGSFRPKLEMLTMPGVLLDEDIEDGIGDPVIVCCSEAREGCKASGLTPNERRLKELIQIGAYGAAINHTTMLLSLYGQGRGRQGCRTTHSPQSLQIWYTRLALLVKTKSYAVAQAEAQPFSLLEKPDVFYQYYPELYGGRTGSMASFNFRLLLSELPMICGKPGDSLRNLFFMWATIKKMLNNINEGLYEDGTSEEPSEAERAESLRLWTNRETKVIYSIINCACCMKDYSLAIELLGKLCQRKEAPRHSLLSALGRLHIQTGNIAGAEQCFNEASLYGCSGAREFVDKGLLAMAQNNYEAACLFFQQASSLDPSNIVILNNMAVCLLYGGQLKEAVAVLETVISSRPMDTLHESLILNLCTLYDMQSSKGIMKKFALLRQISKYSADAPTTILEKLYG